MIFDNHTYSVLLVSSSEKFSGSLMTLLPSGYYSPVKQVTNIAAARRESTARHYDLVIINTPLPDDFGIRFAMDQAAETNSAVVVFVQADHLEEVHAKVVNYGVYTLPKPVSSQLFGLALKWMVATRERLQRMEKKAATLEDRMAEIRLINRAKWLLIERLHMSEPDAHRFIEKQAMDRSASKVAIANTIIKTYT